MKDLFFAKSIETPKLKDMLTEINKLGVKLPKREGQSRDEWLAQCASVLPRETWVRLVLVME